ncbi:MAG: hypothetical protein PSU93_01720 [Methylobacter sp.]|uniref:Uncharacterized protein n=1 Tax=Candidatus Methylobacter titanis TaxID=3053457 RepID=A0AA43Q527_9GAMM|nr:hypothetical protein [Candidatus Methylobacter titanis]
MQLIGRIKALEALVRHKTQSDKPIDFEADIGDPGDYDPDLFELLALTTGRRVILPNTELNGAQLRRERWGYA